MSNDTRNGVLQSLKAASEGLLYPSETDAAFEPFVWPESVGQVPSKEAVASFAKVQVSAVTSQKVAAFFKSVITKEDWHNAEEQQTVLRFQNLLQVLKDHLSDLAVFKVGSAEKDVYIVGRGRDGLLYGLKTKVVET